MTRKDYVTIGHAFAQAFHETDNKSHAEGIMLALDSVSEALKLDNSGFNEHTFRKFIAKQTEQREL